MWWDGGMRPDGPSITARVVAANRARLERPAAPTGDPGADDRLCAELAEGFGGDYKDVFEWVSARTAFFDGEVLAALAAGVPQIVILGAGYDGRALRFATPGVTFFEVDHPNSQADKQARVGALGADLAGVTFVAHDLAAGSLDNALAAAGHSASAPTLFIAEGLLRYLPEPTIHELFALTAARSAPGSVFALTFSTREAEVVVSQEERDHEAMLAELGEHVLTLPSRATALGWLAGAGWDAEVVDDVATEHSQPGDGRLLIRATPADGLGGTAGVTVIDS